MKSDLQVSNPTHVIVISKSIYYQTVSVLLVVYGGGHNSLIMRNRANLQYNVQRPPTYFYISKPSPAVLGIAGFYNSSLDIFCPRPRWANRKAKSEAYDELTLHRSGWAKNMSSLTLMFNPKAPDPFASGRNWPNSDSKSSWFWNSLATCEYTSDSVNGL